MPTPSEAAVLKDVLKSSAQGGSVSDPNGNLSAGTDVPLALQNNPALRQLLQESVMIQSGKNGHPSPVVTSADNKSEFDTNKSTLGDKQTALDAANAKAAADKTAAAEASAAAGAAVEPKFNEDTGRVEANSDPVSDSLNKWEADRKAEFDKQAADRKTQYDSLYTTSLAAIDSATAATIENIKASYDKRIGEQRRINDINIARVKAYGLGSGGQYTPIAFSDAVSSREQEAADQISTLEGQRTNLIAQAQAAANNGRADLLRTHMEDLNKIEDQLRTNLKDVFTEASKQYDVLRTLREKAETDHKTKLEEARKRLALIASSYLDQFDGKDQAGKDALIKQLMSSTGLDYATIFGEMTKASQDAAILKTKNAKDARGELKTIDGNLYEVTYDDAGKATSKLVQAKAPKAGSGGSGSSGSVVLTPTDKKKMAAQGLDPNDKSDVDQYIKSAYGDKDVPEEVLTFADFEKLAADATDENGQPLYNQSNDALKAKYDEYVSEAKGAEQSKTLTPTDKKKMLAADLDPNDPADVQAYIKKNYKPKVPGPTTKPVKD